jgi:hypothetical protein
MVIEAESQAVLNTVTKHDFQLAFENGRNAGNGAYAQKVTTSVNPVGPKLVFDQLAAPALKIMDDFFYSILEPTAFLTNDVEKKQLSFASKTPSLISLTRTNCHILYTYGCSNLKMEARSSLETLATLRCHIPEDSDIHFIAVLLYSICLKL